MKKTSVLESCGMLRCPVCAAPLHHESAATGVGSLLCSGERRHCFDIAKQGYVHLCPRHSGGGDSADAVAARTAFLTAGYYSIALRALCDMIDTHVGGGLVIDAGCGEGYYTAGVAAHLGEGSSVFGFDLSRDAVATAAKAAKRQGVRVGYAVASVFDLPLADDCANGVVNVFAPCCEAEYRRVLKKGGKLVVVGAGERHLMGLKRAIYDDVYINTERADLPVEMRMIERKTVEDVICVEGRQHIAALFSMTPYYWRTPRAAAQRLARLDRLETEIAFDFMVYEK